MIVPAPPHDPGGTKRWPLQPGVRGAAAFSPCGRYRHLLIRAWGPLTGPYLLAIAANPSTAERNIDDPTIRKLISFARREGMTRLVMTNVCDYRATHPKRLLDPAVLPRSDKNLMTIRKSAERASIILVAFGIMHPTLLGYVQSTVRALRGFNLWCLGATAGGWPRHPLYVPNDTPIERWYPEDAKAR